MRTFGKSLMILSAITAAPLFAGALWLEIGNPAANPEAQMKKAVLVARVTACKSPAKTTVMGTAEGIVNGVRKSIPLNVISLSMPGTYAVTREWPEQGRWAVKMIVVNPDYKDYTPSVMVPVGTASLNWAAVKHYSRAPTDSEVAEVLAGKSSDTRASVN